LSGWVGWWSELAATAQRMPSISSRQRAVLGGVVASQSNATIGRHVHASEATLKREVGALTSTLKAGARAALVAVAISFGIEPRQVRP
jgi:DNA-binding NarL/FixJ family response regulator